MSDHGYSQGSSAKPEEPDPAEQAVIDFLSSVYIHGDLNKANQVSQKNNNLDPAIDIETFKGTIKPHKVWLTTNPLVAKDVKVKRSDQKVVTVFLDPRYSDVVWYEIVVQKFGKKWKVVAEHKNPTHSRETFEEYRKYNPDDEKEGWKAFDLK